ncbi:MAG: hypothetical protein U0K92_07620 [Treponema sp.]|nr:hypothetical protein [Treponema sp.]
MIPDYFNYLIPYYFIPVVPDNFKKPPRLYDLMESIVNYGKTDKEKIKDLAKYSRSTIFDFEYPLTSHINKEQFEINILNHFITRRIGAETFTIFQIMLNTKLNEIMPKYNKLFDAMQNWDIFGDGEKTIRTGEDNRDVNSETTNILNNNSTTESNNISDKRFSDTPQNNIEEVQDGTYITNYNYDTNTNNTKDESESRGSSNNFTKDNNIYNETITKTNSNKIEIMLEMQKNIDNIYSLIYNDLNNLFYGLV